MSPDEPDWDDRSPEEIIEGVKDILRKFDLKEVYIDGLVGMSWLTRIQPEDPHKRARCLRCGAALSLSLAEEDIMMHCENCGEIHDSMRVLSEESGS